MNRPQQFKAAVVRIYFSTKKHVSERKILLTDMQKLLKIKGKNQPVPESLSLISGQ